MLVAVESSGFLNGFDLTGLGGLSLGTLVFAFVFRTLWRQDGAWKKLLDEERVAATGARADAAAARADAAEARSDAKEAREATERCELEHDNTRKDLDETNRQLDRLLAHLAGLGIPLPDDTARRN